MSTSVIAGRYAEALFSAAQDNGGADTIAQIDQDLAGIVQLLDTTPDLDRLWKHPVVDVADKRQLVGQIFGGKIHPLTLNFLRLLFDKKRGMLIGGIQKAYRERFNAIRKRQTVKVTSALPLDSHDQEALRHQLATRFAQEIEMETAVDASLIGGLVLQIGDSVIDNSLRGRLAALRQSLN